MKQKQPYLCRHGFTLIELMVVIAIIAVLAAISTPMISRAFHSANRARANTEARSIHNAVMNYLNEYGRFPHGNNPAGNDYRYGTLAGANAENHQLMNVLRAIGETTDEPGNDAAGNVNHVNNPRRIVFLEAAEESLSEATGFNYWDPWEQQYEIVVDTNFDGEIDVGGFPEWSGTIENRRVGVWSSGNEVERQDRHIRTW